MITLFTIPHLKSDNKDFIKCLLLTLGIDFAVLLTCINL